MNRMLNENHVSPRTYENKKKELENWASQEREELKKTENEIERGF